MRDGLEINELLLSDVLNDNITKRIDSEYFLKNDLYKLKLLYSFDNSLTDSGVVVKGGKRIPLGETFSEIGYPYIRAEDIKGLFFTNEMSPKINENIFNKLKKYQLNENDVVLTIVGNSISDVGLYKSSQPKTILTENCVLLRGGIFRYQYLLAFFLSSYGQMQIRRETVGSAQPKLSIERIRSIKIPNISTEAENLVIKLVDLSYSLHSLSHDFYVLAERKLNNYVRNQSSSASNNEKNSINIVNSKNSLDLYKRIDSDFYLPYYYELSDCLDQNFERATITINSKNFKPANKEFYHYIELSNIKARGNIVFDKLEMGAELPTRARRLVRKGDVLVSSIEGSLDSCALITSDLKNIVCSNGFYVVKSSDINSETLFMLFKSRIIQDQLKRWCSGTILTSINLDDMNNIFIPSVPSDIQNSIANDIKKMYILSDYSESVMKMVTELLDDFVEKKRFNQDKANKIYSEYINFYDTFSLT